MCKHGNASRRHPKLISIAAEEIQDASTVVPWVMTSSIMLNGVMGFALLVCIQFPGLPSQVLNEIR